MTLAARRSSAQELFKLNWRGASGATAAHTPKRIMTAGQTGMAASLSIYTVSHLIIQQGDHRYT